MFFQPFCCRNPAPARWRSLTFGIQVLLPSCTGHRLTACFRIYYYLPNDSSPASANCYPTVILDHVGGHIVSSTWVPTSSLDVRLPELVRTLQDKEQVVFHCALSQQRGPSAALRYARERARVLGDEEAEKQKVSVLDGGFVQWQEKYGEDARLTEAYVKDIWQDY